MEEKERYEFKYNEKIMKHYMFDNLTKTQLGYEDITNLLNQQDKENQQLKALLKATEITDIHNELADLQINNEWLEKENQQLKQQLAESEEEHELLINQFEEETEKLRKQIKQESDARKRFVEEVKNLKQQLTEKEKEIENLNNRILISQLQAPEEQRLKIIGSSCCQYNPKQDKISFAVDILEELAGCSNYINSKLDFECGSYVSEKAIRDKIKYLKGKKDE